MLLKSQNRRKMANFTAACGRAFNIAGALDPPRGSPSQRVTGPYGEMSCKNVTGHTGAISGVIRPGHTVR